MLSFQYVSTDQQASEKIKAFFIVKLAILLKIAKAVKVDSQNIRVYKSTSVSSIHFKRLAPWQSRFLYAGSQDF